MNLVIPVGQKETQSAAANSSGHGRAPFSRASHFANILLPVAFAIAYALIRDYLAGFSHSNHAFWLQAFTVGMVTVGLGGSLLVLKGIEQLEDFETKK